MAYERPVFTSTTARLRDMLARNWFLPFTSFGGPAVHFQIVRLPRIDDGTNGN